MRPFLIALLLLTGCGARRWGAFDTTLQIAYTATVAADYVQTRDIVADGREANPILDPKYLGVPSGLYFPAIALGNYAIMRRLPPTPRRMLQWAILGIQVFNVHRNRVYGYGFMP